MWVWGVVVVIVVMIMAMPVVVMVVILHFETADACAERVAMFAIGHV